MSVLSEAAYDAFAAMRGTEMQEWVGGGHDPAYIGQMNFDVLCDNLRLRPDFRVFDFGCGIGRTAVPLAAFLGKGHLVGSDIVPAQIRFCREEITTRFPNSEFHCPRAQNPLYDHLISEDHDGTISEAEFFAAHRETFDLVVGFSVFTHFDPGMAYHYLCQLRDVTKSGGLLLLTWFFDRPDNPPGHHLPAGADFADLSGNLGLALYSVAQMQELVGRSQLQLERLNFGWWRHDLKPTLAIRGQHPQDCVILAKP